jgi:rRNA maturation RNase YbeY
LEEIHSIEFYYEEVEFELVDTERHISWLSDIASTHNKIIGELSYIFSHDEKVLEINKQYLDHDYYTDIISFPYELNPISGDIYISIDRVKENAKDLGIDFQDELHRVMAHGLLHFIGFDDHNEADIKAMRNAESNAIKQYKILG